jgi:hypothetical protein
MTDLFLPNSIRSAIDALDEQNKRLRYELAALRDHQDELATAVCAFAFDAGMQLGRLERREGLWFELHHPEFAQEGWW